MYVENMIRSLRGVVVVATLTAVAAPVAVAARTGDVPTMAASARTLAFGDTLSLTGKTSAPKGTEVQVMSQACGFTGPVPIGTAHVAAGGAYKFLMQPTLNASYFVQIGEARSKAARVTISPSLQIRRVSAKAFAVDASAGAGEFFTSTVTLQSLTAQHHWRTVASGHMKQNSDPGAVTAVSTALVHASVKHGTQLRAVMSQQAVGTCYRPAKSATFTA